jgi:hypothetical protein
MKKSPNKTHNLAKLLTIISILFLGNLTAKGQYINPYSYASALSYTLENDRLKNITFNENELKLDADAWEQYKYYQERNADYDDPKGDTALGWSLGLLSSGGLIMTIGAIGVLVQNDRYNDHKKEMIIYLKTNHNGLGIVSVF